MTNWKNLNVGDIVTLKDKISLDLSLKDYGNLEGKTYTINRKTSIKQNEANIEWYIYDMSIIDDRIWLVVKCVGDNSDFYVYFAPEFDTGNRQDMMDTDRKWLFQNPFNYHGAPSEYNLNLNDLKYSTQIKWVDDDKDVVYIMKQQGELQATAEETPNESNSSLIATVVEYQCECTNPEMMILEIGNPDSNEGGFIRILVGTLIRDSEVTVLTAN